MKKLFNKLYEYRTKLTEEQGRLDDMDISNLTPDGKKLVDQRNELVSDMLTKIDNIIDITIECLKK